MIIVNLLFIEKQKNKGGMIKNDKEVEVAITINMLGYLPVKYLKHKKRIEAQRVDPSY